MSASRFVVGVDAGGTGTRALLMSEDGRHRAEVEGAAGLLDPVDPARSARAIADTVRTAAAEAGVPLPLEVLWAGVAGAGREDGRAALRIALEDEAIATRIEIGTDAEAAFHDAFGEGAAGILLIVGTGSIAWARGPDGRMGRCGGWGGLLGDEGSGYRIGIEALRAVCRVEDGRERPTHLPGLLLPEAGLARIEELVPWAARSDKMRIAALAPTVIRAADEGDPVALRILDEGVRELVRQAEVVAYRVGCRPPFEVALAGGLVGFDGPLRGRLGGGLERHGFEVSDVEVHPVRGAAELALRIPGGEGSAGGALLPAALPDTE